jgi:hypothetical protein
MREIKLCLHRLKCIYWNWRIPLETDALREVFNRIDHRKDKSLSGKDFRLFMYKYFSR